MLTTAAVLGGASVGSNLLTGYLKIMKTKKTHYTGRKILNATYLNAKIQQSLVV